ncbi:MAG TPA: hypothetical protein VM661_10025 [Candidatus Sulfotelmatobacter sp.]|nr:hypothetical protein [Candidatus Sulfotelmatobacter sp.]
MLVHLAQAAHKLPASVDLAFDRVTIGQAAGRPPLGDGAGLAAADFGSQVFQEQGVHGALQPDMQFADFAFRGSDQFHPGEGQALIDRCGILKVAGQSVQGLGHDAVDLAVFGVGQQAHGIRATGEMGAGQSIVGIDVGDLAAQAGDMLTAQTHLILDRAFVLMFRAIAGIDGPPRHGVSAVWFVRP